MRNGMKNLHNERLSVPVTPELLQALDDYCFTKRIRSRAEVVRMLIEDGLARAGHPIAPPEPTQTSKTRGTK